MATSKEIEASIEAQRPQLDAMSAALDDKIRKYAAAIPMTVGTWIQAEVARVIEKNAAKINETDGAKLAAFKADLAALQKRLGEICLAAISEEAEWPHRETRQSPKDYWPRGRVHEPYFEKAFRRAIGSLGRVLYDHHMIPIQAAGSSPWKGSGGQFEYTWGIAGESMEPPGDLIKSYSELHEKFNELARTSRRLQDDLVKARAREKFSAA